MSVLKTEGKSFLFHIGNEFRNMISVTSEVDFYVEGFFGRFSLTRTQQFKLILVLQNNREGHTKKDILVFNLIP